MASLGALTLVVGAAAAAGVASVAVASARRLKVLASARWYSEHSAKKRTYADVVRGVANEGGE